jgi:hypothetical protein
MINPINPINPTGLSVPEWRLIHLLNWLHEEDMNDGHTGMDKWPRVHDKVTPKPNVAPVRYLHGEPIDMVEKVKELVTWHRDELYSWMKKHKNKHDPSGTPELLPPPQPGPAEPAEKTLNKLLQWWHGEGDYVGCSAYDWIYKHAKDYSPAPSDEPPPPPDPWD